MRRREVIALMGASITWPFAATAQEPGRTYRLGGLSPLPREAPLNMAYLGELRRHGFIEGQNLAVEYRAYGENVDLIQRYATELIMARVDVIGVAGD
jgi:putative tryptophan/tyrosine transport system substrate-binding protein